MNRIRHIFRRWSIESLPWLGALAGLLVSVTLPGAALGTTWYVATNGDESAAGSNGWPSALRSISNAVFQAGVNDTIVVSNGVYTLTTNISITKGITLTGFLGRAATMINGNWPNTTNRCLVLGHTNAIVDGFTLSNGYATSGSGFTNYGGGVYMTNGTLRNCIVQNNIATNGAGYGGGYGGGIYVINAGSLISDCQIISNVASYSAGGLYASSAMVTNCLIAKNSTLYSSTAYGGGGAYASTGSRLTGCVISNNVSYGRGGGVYIYDCTVSNCVIVTNESKVGSAATSGSGGGAFLYYGYLYNSVVSNNFSSEVGGYSYSGGGGIASLGYAVRDCTIVGNTAAKHGGGVMAGDNIGLYTTIERCTISRNKAQSGSGGGLYLYANVFAHNLLNSTVSANTATVSGGGGVYMRNGVNVLNCVIANNSASSSLGGGMYIYGSSTERTNNVRNCLIAGNSADTYGGGGVGYAYDVNSYDGLFENCTIVSNYTAATGGGGVYSAYARGWYTNCIIYTNRSATAANNNIYSGTYGYCLSVSNAYFNPTINNNMDADPRFVSVTNANFRLASGSPCANAGLIESWMTGATDLDGFPRIDRLFGRVDIGAYEYLPPITLFKAR